MINFATKEDIKMPKGGLILEERTEKDYILGSKDPKNFGKVVLAGGHWRNYTPVQEIQRVADGDTYGCTGFSDNNIDEFIHRCKYGMEINISDMYVVVGSGTRQGVGNTMKAPAEFKRKGFVMESDYPYSRSMTLNEFYAPIPQRIFDLASKCIYDSGYLFTNSSGQNELLSALEVSPVKVAIEGSYVFDSNGRLKTTGSGYNHAVVIFDYELDGNGNVLEWWIFDSETQQYIKARGDYAFLSPMVKFLEKKTLKMYKKIGQAGIGFVNELKDGLILWTDGVDSLGRPVIGGSIFKTMGLSYNLAEPCEEWPLPIVGYASVKPNL